MNFTYDVGDYRLRKQTTNTAGNTTKNFYIRDATGNPMAVYQQIAEWVEGVWYENTYLLENTLYGHSDKSADYYAAGVVSASDY